MLVFNQSRCVVLAKSRKARITKAKIDASTDDQNFNLSHLECYICVARSLVTVAIMMRMKQLSRHKRFGIETIHYLDCKTVGFVLKISKEIDEAWRKSRMRAKRASLTRPSACEASEKTQKKNSVSPQFRSLFLASFQPFV